MSERTVINIPAMPPEVIETMRDSGAVLLALGEKLSGTMAEAHEQHGDATDDAHIIVQFDADTAKQLAFAMLAMCNMASMLIQLSEQANAMSVTVPNGTKIH